jgi:anaerobic ribonucleoside-triphosphate reductase activating protein
VKIHRTLAASRVNGPGSRFVVWVQGCSRCCSGCFNPDTHDPNGGYDTAVPEIIKQIPLTGVEGITVSGGEPFEQAENLLALLEAIGKMGLHRLVYTGYTYDALRSLENRAADKCLAEIDMLIDGAFEKGIPPYMPWTGSGNQRVMQLEGGKVKRIYAKHEIESAAVADGEIVICQDGGVLTTGIIDSRVF